MVTLSLCMIVKDEEAHIERCLSSVKPYVDEMIVVDTGSTDQTVNLCKAAGARVYSYQWDHHFANARNFSLEQASGDWILWMDADEELTVHAEDWKKRLEAENVPLFNVHLINYIGESPNPNETYHIAHPRLFRRGIGLRFLYSIHEALNVEEVFHGEHALQEIKQLDDLTLYHYGYLEPINTARQKNERNLNLLQQELHAEHSNPWTEYHLASEYYRTGQYAQAYEFVNLSIARFLNNGKLPPSLLYKLKYACLLSSDSVEGLPAAIDKALKLYPDYVDLYFFKGVALWKNNQCAEAVTIFEQCIDMGDGNISHLTLSGSGSFHAWYYRGLCLEKLGQITRAQESYQKVLELFPGYTPAQEALQALEAK